MTDASDFPPLPERVTTGVAGLDRILGGGLFQNGIYIVGGRPGSGKTTLANQFAYHHVGGGGTAVYVTMLAESHARMLALLQGMSFFRREHVGVRLHYVNGYTSIEQKGLTGLLELVRRVVRDHKATLLVLDGMVTAEGMAESDVAYKKFIHELQTWMEVVGCTVLVLTSAASGSPVRAEHTMVDGIIELTTTQHDLRRQRQLAVSKLRGSAFLEGDHVYRITSDGLVVYPRTEVLLDVERGIDFDASARLSTGVPSLDALLRGGLVRGSTTMILGNSGSGKTLLGMHFLAAGLSAGEPGLHFGFFEPPATLVAKAERFGFAYASHVEAGRLAIRWRPAAERILDELAADLLRSIERTGARRVFIDGLVGFMEAAMYPSRVSAFFATLTSELSARGVTTLISEETRELFVQHVEVPTSGVSAIFHNIFFLRQVEMRAELLRLLSVMKTRDSDHDDALWRFDIGGRGLALVERYQPTTTVFTGVSSVPSPGGIVPVAPRVGKAKEPRKKTTSPAAGKGGSRSGGGRRR